MESETHNERNLKNPASCPMCGATGAAAGKCPSCGEVRPSAEHKRCVTLPFLPPIETMILYPIVFAGLAAALLLPLIAWLRQLLNRF